MIKMFKQTFTDLTSIPKENVIKWLSTFDTVLTDCDGVLWLHNQTIENSPAVINKLQEIGKKVFFLTNNSTKTRAEFLEKAVNMNFKMTEDGIISTAYVAAKYLEKCKFNKKVYVIGSNGIAKELDAVGIKHVGIGPDVMNNTFQNLVYEQFKPDAEIGAVIVGFDEHFSFPKMLKAVTYLNNPNCLFIATNTDERFPMPGCVIPGTGSFVRAIETSAERNAIVMGKPNPYICETLMSDHNIIPSRTLMIGDRCNTDILLGTNCGFQTLLVGTGVHNLGHVKEWHQNNNIDDKKLIPDVYLPKLGDLLPLIQ